MLEGCDKKEIGMIQIAVCDTVEQDRANIKNLCNEFLQRNLVEYELQEYTSGESLFEADFPDILLLDVKLEKIDGLLVKEILEKKRSKTRIIFVSHENKFMNQAFGKNVYGFLSKPIQKHLLYEKLEQVVEDVCERSQYTFCKNEKNIEKVYLKDILYINSYGRYTKLFVRGEEHYKLSDKSIGEWNVDMNQSNFISCHRCYLVNFSYVKEIQRDVELINGVHLPLSQDKQEWVHKAYKEFIWRKSNGKNDEKIL